MRWPWGYNNSDFVTIAAAPGATPVLHSLVIEGSSKWVLKGLTIERLASGYAGIVNISEGSRGPVSNIVFDHNTIFSQSDASAWTQAQWVANASWEGITTDDEDVAGSSCISITNNALSNLRNGVTLGIDHSLFAGNTITNFGDDGVDYYANDLLLSHNTITNNITLADGNHNDAMQGQIGRHPSGYTNVTIDGNTVIRRMTTPDPFSGSAFQGIDAFDSNWTNLTVTNNLIVTDLWNGLDFASVHGGLIANNTVLNDGTNSGTDAGDTWLTIGDTTHEGTPTNNLIVQNNISGGLVVNTAGATVQNNIALNHINLLLKGVETYYNKAGSYGNNNVLYPSLLSSLPGFKPQQYQFNVNLSGGKIAVTL